MSDPEQPTPEQRSAFRAFVRDHHPDRGGDPAAFAAGVDRFRTGPGDSSTDGHPVPNDGDRPAAPLPFPVRVGVALIRTWRRRHEHHDPS